jgi:hypothetical protein
MKYHLTSAVLVVAAIALEIAGFGAVETALGVVLLAAGVGLELWFWVRVFRPDAVRAGS